MKSSCSVNLTSAVYILRFSTHYYLM